MFLATGLFLILYCQILGRFATQELKGQGGRPSEPAGTLGWTQQWALRLLRWPVSLVGAVLIVISLVGRLS